MSNSPVGRVRRVAFSVAALGGALATVGYASVPAWAQAQAKTKTTTVSYKVSCNEGALGTADITGKFVTTLPTTVAAGATIKGTGSGTIVVPVALVDAGITFYQATSFDGSITTLNVVSSDATPSPLNAAGAGINLPSTNVFFGKPATLKIKGIKYSFTAGAPGTDTVTNGTSVSTTNIYDGTTEQGSITGSCTPVKVVTLGTVTVS